MGAAKLDSVYLLSEVLTSLLMTMGESTLDWSINSRVKVEGSVLTEVQVTVTSLEKSTFASLAGLVTRMAVKQSC